LRDAHFQLDHQVQRWIFNQGWQGLRDVQAQAIVPILSGDTDVLISAATAAGKTEAFFLPACSALMRSDKRDNGVGILYISPLKALINDQYRRLESLAELLDLQVTPWHADSSLGQKRQQKKSPSGIILITPESLESLLVRDMGWVKQAFSNLQYIVIDEFHAFLGGARGQHLLSLLTRLEHVTDRITSPIPRVALSATLGELQSVLRSLRPNQSLPCTIIEDSNARASVKVQVKGYVQPSQLTLNTNQEQADSEYHVFEGIDVLDTAETKVCADLYRLCRGGNHLVFANSRARTELIAAGLSDLCEYNTVPNEFFPHHGSLSKELRESLESRLQKEALPTTAVCTMTLELGIDIGKVDTVIQVTAPHSVASLRQRLGRSGRRGGSAVLRMLITEHEINKDSSLIDDLRLELIQSLAMIRLLITDKWFEPANTSLYHFSTLLHQVLALVGQWGGIRADQIYVLLCNQGPFQKVKPAHFKLLLIQMGAAQLLTQLGNNQLVLGVMGERIVSHYTFYAVFKTPEEYRIVAGNKTLGTLPIDTMILPDQYIIFGGKRWQVKDVDVEKKIVDVIKVKGGGKPPTFGDSSMSIHDKVRQEMIGILNKKDYRIQVGSEYIDFADTVAKQLFLDSIKTFERYDLSHQSLVNKDGSCYIFMWRGDSVVNTLVALLLQHGFTVESYAGVICVLKTSSAQVYAFLQKIAQRPVPTATELAKTVPNKMIEKFDEYLPDELLDMGYGAQAFDIEGLDDWLRTFSK